MKKIMETKDPCVHCGKSTAFGSGRFVDRIGYDDGWACAECMTIDETYRITLSLGGYQVSGVRFNDDGKLEDIWPIRGLKADTETELRTLVEQIYQGVKYNPRLPLNTDDEFRLELDKKITRGKQ